jgi:hypothetical protein
LGVIKYVFGLLGAAGLGGFVGVVFQEVRLDKAVALGIAAPALITIMVINSQKPLTTDSNLPQATPQQQTPSGGSARLSLLPEAWAQAIPTVTSDEVRKRFVETYASRESQPFVAEFRGSGGKVINSAEFNAGNPRRLEVPPDAVSIRFRRGEYMSSAVPIPDPPEILACEVKVTAEKKFGFATAFGAEPIAYVFKVDTSLVRLAPAGQTGWVYVGKWGGESWDSLFLSLSPVSLPVPGVRAEVKFPLNLRTEPPTGEQIGRVRLGQIVEILEPRDTGNGHYWANVRVIK